MIEAKNLGKHYRRYARPMDSLIELITRRPRHETFSALENVSFSLPAGGTLGLVGNNGAGKSTLLKLLARTSDPSEGSLTINGRVAAILELGSGFHPDFTGLENIRLGCSLMGLTAAETADRLPEIVAFSELGEFIHQPVKTYSSGMYVRLAFSVVTSVDPDVLVIDEALSVGDQHFQKKSLDRIRGFIAAGKTVVFCSHNLYQVKSLCQKALWLENGQPRMLGDATEVVDAYQDAIREADANAPAPEAAFQPREARFEQVALDRGGEEPVYRHGDPLTLTAQMKSDQLGASDMHFAAVIMRNDELHIYGTSTEIDAVPVKETSAGLFEAELHFPALELLSGHYRFYLYVLDENGLHVFDKREGCLPFRVRHEGREIGITRLAHEWRQK